VWYYEPTTYRDHTRHISHWIGVTHRVGQAMCYWVLPESGIPITRSIIQAVSREEIQTDEVKSLLLLADLSVQEKLTHSPGNPLPFTLYREDQEDDLLDDEPMEPDSSIPDVENTKADMYDSLLFTEPILSHNGQEKRARVIGRKRGPDGNPVGHCNPNLLLNSRA
jgi:hypothetical protein